MDKVKRIILLHVPMSVCNFRCHYCFLTHRKECFQNIQPEMKYSPEHVARALSKERLGGAAYINICAEGETLLTQDIEKYIECLAKEGHYIEIVSNMTITKVLDKILSLDESLLSHITFKCSFHYLQLKEKNLLDVFADNVKRVWATAASANVEVTPSDRLIPFIDELKEFSMKNFGALPHLTIARNDATDNIDYLTELPIDEYDNIWSQFNSEFWEFKKTIFKHKRKEFCYAGDWLLCVNLANGNTQQCYNSNFHQNVFADITKPIRFCAIGKCKEPHCYNGHALLTLGCIPEITGVKYGDIRNRVCDDGFEWIKPSMKAFLNSTLTESNEKYSKAKMASSVRNTGLRDLTKKLKIHCKKIIGQRTVTTVKRLFGILK